MLLTVANARAQAPQEAESAPAAMTWTDLVARPELWPRSCKVFVAYTYPEDAISLDETYTVVAIDAQNVEVVLPSGSTGTVPFGDTDALAVANNSFLQMSPAQRALDLKTLVERADLWPTKVTLMKTVTTGHAEGETKYPKGSEVDFGFFDGRSVRVRHRDLDAAIAINAHNTDFVERVRAVVEDKRKAAVHRVLQDVEGKIVNLRTGKPARVNPKSPPDYVLIYFSAGWCGPCHNFSPSLVRFYEQNKKLVGKRFDVIWISRDRSEAEMKEYAQELKFPWLAVAWNQLAEVPIAQAHSGGGIPGLVMLDSKGAVVAASFVDGKYVGADSVLKVLAERVSSAR